jgi:MerR family transcriptional regulator, light-induced transcriptional regulator
LVFIRDKKVKGHLYAYLVKNTWDNSDSKVKQKIVKYLGKSSKVTIKDIPKEFHEDPNILAFIAAHSSDVKKTEEMEFSMRERMLDLLINYDIEALLKTFEKYSRIFGLVKFYERLLTPVMYKVGELWSNGTLDIATEHICSNAAHTLVKIINEKVSKQKQPSTEVMKILLCTPEGELHSLGCMVIESVLMSKGYSVFNIAPSVPSTSLISFANKLEPDLIIISITLTENLHAANRLINDILSTKADHPPILLGGAGISSVKKIQGTKVDKVAGVKFLKDVPLSGILLSIKESIKDNKDV